MLGLVAFGAVVAAVCAGEAASAPIRAQTGHWKVADRELVGSFTISADGRDVTGLHGTIQAGATNGCPVVKPGQKLVIPGKLPIIHNPSADTYQVSGKNFAADQFLAIHLVVNGHRIAGFISIGWVTAKNADVNVTYGSLHTGCHIQFAATAG